MKAEIVKEEQVENQKKKVEASQTIAQTIPIKTFYGKGGQGKLVRDKVLNQLADKGIDFGYLILGPGKRTDSLLQKLEEEYNELLVEKTGTHAWREELADVLEVIAALMQRCVSLNGGSIPVTEVRPSVGGCQRSTLMKRFDKPYQKLLREKKFGPEWRTALAEISCIFNEIRRGDDIQIDETRVEKHKVSGGFDEGYLLIWTAEDKEWVA